MTSSDAVVFDTGPLRHFATQGWLGVLKFRAANRPVLIPESAERELSRCVHELDALRQVLEADWITFDHSNDTPFLVAFSDYENRLVVGDKNRWSVAVRLRE